MGIRSGCPELPSFSEIGIDDRVVCLKFGESEGPRPTVSRACVIDLRFLQRVNSNNNSVSTTAIDTALLYLEDR